MPRNTKIAAGNASLHVFKEKRGWTRDMQVRLTPAEGGAHRDVDFPGDRDVLEIDGLQPGATYRVEVRRKHLLNRFRNPSVTHEVTLRPRPLRVLLTGSGRCGTQTLAHYLDGMRFRDGETVRSLHEPLSEFVVRALIEGETEALEPIQTGLGHNVESAPYYAIYPQAICADRVVHVIRDGRRVVQSGLNRGWYQNDGVWNRLKPDFPGDAFAKACHLWRLTNENALELTDETHRLEDLVASDEARRALTDSLEIETDGRQLPHSNKGRSASTFDAWDDARTGTFREICGELMDRFYPGWDRD